MSSHIETLQSFISLATLRSKIKDTAQRQRSMLKILDPCQSKINDFVKAKVEKLFENSPSNYSRFDRLVISGVVSIIGGQVLSYTLPDRILLLLPPLLFSSSFSAIRKSFYRASPYVKNFIDRQKTTAFHSFFLRHNLL